MWTCPKCATKVDPAFDVCWSCGTTADGVEDPDFVAADDAGPIGDPTDDAVAVAGGVTGAGHDGAGGLVSCYQALSLIEAKFIVNELAVEGVAATCDEQDFQDSLGGWTGNPRVYVHGDDLAKARAWLESYEQRRRAEAGPAD